MQPIEIPQLNRDECGAIVRGHLIERRLLVPLEARRPRHFTPHIALDQAGIDAAALELCALQGLEAARQIASEPSTDTRLADAIRVLLTLTPGELKNRVSHFRAHARREERALAEADR